MITYTCDICKSKVEWGALIPLKLNVGDYLILKKIFVNLVFLYKD